MNLEMINKTKYKTPKKELEGILKSFFLAFKKYKNKKISLALVSLTEIKKINNSCRKKNIATDVLSFLLEEDDCWGEIIICPEVAKRQAQENKMSFKQEMQELFLHGLLHLAGFDHIKEEDKKIMIKAEKRVKKYLD